MQDTPQDTRHAIIETSTRLFAERGFAGVSIRDITNTLRLTPGAIYHHFANKQELYDVIVVAAFERVMEQFVIPAGLRGPPEERLRSVVLRLAAFISSAPVEMQMVDRVIFEAVAPLTERVTAIVDRTHEALAAIIHEIDPASPAAAFAEHVIAAVYGAQKLRPIRDRLTKATGLGTPLGLAESVTDFTLRALGRATAPPIAAPKSRGIQKSPGPTPK